jgi:hypothetical protein
MCTIIACDPCGARTLSPNLTSVTAFKRDAGSMKREAQQLSGGQLTPFIILKLQQYYERSPAFMAVFDVDSRMNSVDNAQQSDRYSHTHHQHSLSVTKRFSRRTDLCRNFTNKNFYERDLPGVYMQERSRASANL